MSGILDRAFQFGNDIRHTYIAQRLKFTDSERDNGTKKKNIYDFKPGDFMLIDDHINMSGSNPLIGKNLDSFGERFPDMSEVYSKKLWQTLQEKAHNEGIETKHGVYMMYSGPSFETPAEIRAFRILGADAVGMSTVPEAIAARHAGMNVMGISVITNMAAGMLDQKLTHEEVLETAEIVRKPFARLIALAIESIQENQ